MLPEVSTTNADMPSTTKAESISITPWISAKISSSLAWKTSQILLCSHLLILSLKMSPHFSQRNNLHLPLLLCSFSLLSLWKSLSQGGCLVQVTGYSRESLHCANCCLHKCHCLREGFQKKGKGAVYIQIIRSSKSSCTITEAHDAPRNFRIL